MNLKEMIAQKSAELAELKSAIEAGEDEAIERGAVLAEEIDKLEAKMEKAEAAQAKLKSMAAPKAADPDQVDEKGTLGEIVAKSFSGKYEKGQRVTLSKAASTFTTPTAAAGFLTDYDKNIVGVREPLRIESLFGHETVSGNAITYLVEGADEGGFDIVGEGGAKPQWSTSYTPVTDSLKKVAAFYKESDELLEDAAWLASNIDNKALYLHSIKREDWLLNDATNGLLARNGVGVKNVTESGLTADKLADAIFEAMMSIQEDSGFEADAILLNPAQYQMLRLGKDGSERYYGGGYFEGGMPNLWGVPTVVTPRVAAKTFVVGNFRQGASIFEKGGVRVEMTNSHDTDFTNNLVTVRVESRLGLAVRYPKAFVKGTIA